MALHRLTSVTMGVPNDLHVGVDDADDLARAEGNLRRLGLDVQRSGRRRTSRAPGACSPGARPRRRRFCTPTISPP